MSTLTVIVFQHAEQAQKASKAIRTLQEQNLIKVDDAAIATRDLTGKPKIKQANELVGKGALGGAFWGMLVGMLFFVPLLGSAIGAGLGAMGGKMADFGIDDDFIKEVSNEIRPGQAALFLLTHDAVVDKVVDSLKELQGKLLHTSLSKADETKLREMIGQA